MPKTRKERTSARRDAYLGGRAKNPHRHTRVLRPSLEESSSAGPSCESGVCPQCAPVLSRHSPIFKAMVHQGSELKRNQSSPQEA